MKNIPQKFHIMKKKFTMKQVWTKAEFFSRKS